MKFEVCEMYEKNILSKILYEQDMSYRDLSKLSGVSKSAIQQSANFEADPKQSTMICIARALGMNVIDIFNLEWRK